MHTPAEDLALDHIHKGTRTQHHFLTRCSVKGLPPPRASSGGLCRGVYPVNSSHPELDVIVWSREYRFL